jgi:hypothetical protein
MNPGKQLVSLDDLEFHCLQGRRDVLLKGRGGRGFYKCGWKMVSSLSLKRLAKFMKQGRLYTLE